MVAVTYSEQTGSGPDWSMVKPNQQVFDYVQQTANNAMAYLAEPARLMYETGAEIYKMVNYSSAMRKARAVVRQITNKSRTNDIVELQTIGELQNASPLMQRFIMADPMVRALYHTDELSGYVDSYTDYNPGISGNDHYDYRRVMNGMWYEEQTSGNVQMDVFYEDTEDDVNLDALGQMDILRTWDFVRSRIKAGKEDPTSLDNEML